MLASAMPTSRKRSGKLFWNVLMPVEPCTSEEIENTGKPLGRRGWHPWPGRPGLVLFHRGPRRAALWLFSRPPFFPNPAATFSPNREFGGRLARKSPRRIDNFLPVGQRKAVAAGGILLGGFDAVTFDGLDPDRHGGVGVGLRLLHRLFDRLINGLQVVTVGDANHVPAQRAHRLERALHAEGVFRDPPGEFRVVIRKTSTNGLRDPWPPDLGWRRRPLSIRLPSRRRRRR